MSGPGKVEIVGGGPGGLYSAILLKRCFPDASVRVTEMLRPGKTQGFGVVFSHPALEFLRTYDAETHELLLPTMERWQTMTLNHPEGTIVIDGVGFAAIGGQVLLQILQDHSAALGVELCFGRQIEDVDELAADLIIGADGINSLVRSSDARAFGCSMKEMNNRYAWFGTHKRFDTLIQSYINHPKGALVAHHYRYSPEMSTFIVELESSGFEGHGLADMDEQESADYCAGLFSEVLDGEALVCNKSAWQRFSKLWCRTWTSGNRALIGDAVHAAHFSIGSGIRLAMEDAFALVAALRNTNTVEHGLELYQKTRVPIAEKFVIAASASNNWYETFSTRMQTTAFDFAYNYLTHSGRVDNAKLRQIAPKFMARYDAQRPAVSDLAG